jgi:hypothetical protein
MEPHELFAWAGLEPLYLWIFIARMEDLSLAFHLFFDAKLSEVLPSLEKNQYSTKQLQENTFQHSLYYYGPKKLVCFSFCALDFRQGHSNGNLCIPFLCYSDFSIPGTSLNPILSKIFFSHNNKK